MSKTIKQWLETLPEPYRSEALENMRQEVSKQQETSISLAMFTAFDWTKTKQGSLYWEEVYAKVTSYNFQIKQLQDRITLIEAKHGVTLNAPPETQKEYQQLKKELETKIHKL